MISPKDKKIIDELIANINSTKDINAKCNLIRLLAVKRPDFSSSQWRGNSNIKQTEMMKMRQNELFEVLNASDDDEHFGNSADDEPVPPLPPVEWLPHKVGEQNRQRNGRRAFPAKERVGDDGRGGAGTDVEIWH